MQKRLVITGGTGLVGRHFINHYANDFEIHALVLKKPDTEQKNVRYYEFDLSVGLDVTLLPRTVDAVIHLAQSEKFRDFPTGALSVFNVSVATTSLLLDYAHKAQASHFVLASTGGIYGANAEPVTESTPVQLPVGPLNYYFSTKYAAEKLVQAYAQILTVSILRPFFIYGHGQRKSMLLPRLVGNIRQRVPVNLQGDEGIVINPVHVTDVRDVIACCLTDSTSRIINVSGPDIVSIRQLANLIGSKVGQVPFFERVDGEAVNIIADNAIMRRLLNRPLTQLDPGVVDLL